MRAVVQRVSRARVTADGSVTGEIAMALLILLGVGRDDTSAVAASMAEKISNLSLEDWFVPVLFQEKDDPQLFRGAPPSKQTVENFQAALATRLGELPPMPGTGFIVSFENRTPDQGRESARAFTSTPGACAPEKMK